MKGQVIKMEQVLFKIKRDDCGYWNITTTDSIYDCENRCHIPFVTIPDTMNSITHWCKNTEGVNPKQAVFIIE